VNVVRGRADARWLPSRHHFALFRLFAFVRLRTADPEPRPGLVLVIDRHQTAYEQHGVALWICLTVTCYLAVTIFAALPLAAALLFSFLLSPVAVHVPMLTIGVLTGGRRRINSGALMAVLTLVAIYFAGHESWARFAAWQFLALIALNALAAVVGFGLRGPIARLERGVLSGS
jgi:hypothetical protein